MFSPVELNSILQEASRLFFSDSPSGDARSGSPNEVTSESTLVHHQKQLLLNRLHQHQLEQQQRQQISFQRPRQDSEDTNYRSDSSNSSSDSSTSSRHPSDGSNHRGNDGLLTLIGLGHIPLLTTHAHVPERDCLLEENHKLKKKVGSLESKIASLKQSTCRPPPKSKPSNPPTKPVTRIPRKPPPPARPLQPTKFCGFCRQNGEAPSTYRSHNCKDEAGLTVCPVLFRYTCELCGATGKRSHTRSYCPLAADLRKSGNPSMVTRYTNFVKLAKPWKN